jgi:hypothetical protein
VARAGSGPKSMRPAQAARNPQKPKKSTAAATLAAPMPPPQRRAAGELAAQTRCQRASLKTVLAVRHTGITSSDAYPAAFGPSRFSRPPGPYLPKSGGRSAGKLAMTYKARKAMSAMLVNAWNWSVMMDICSPP